jgi:ATP-binding cassette, subfamily A (ABC1), member 3
MVGGRLRCLGTAQHLKNRHGSGFVVEVKLTDPTHEDIAAAERALLAAAAEKRAGGGATASGGAAGGGVPAGYLTLDGLKHAAAALGVAERLEQIKEAGSGWAVAAAYAASTLPAAGLPLGERAVAAADVAAWWAEESAVGAAVDHLTREAFPGASLVERHGLRLRFSVPPLGGVALSSLFGRLDAASLAVPIVSSSLSQTSLETIFNNFASQQDEEKDVARGVLVAKGAEDAAPAKGKEGVAAPAAAAARVPVGPSIEL